jgi:Fe2+ transport system protein FeoA
MLSMANLYAFKPKGSVMQISLDLMKPGESGVVKAVGGNGQLRRRLIAMGISSGACLTVRKLAPFGDPMEINIRNYALAIRLKDAQSILVDKTAIPICAKKTKVSS